VNAFLPKNRWDSDNTHGTGCTLSSSLAAALALGEQHRQQNYQSTPQGLHHQQGATKAIGIVDACCLAKAYVSAGIINSVRYGRGPGPVAQTKFPDSHEHFPVIVSDPTQESLLPFPAMKAFNNKNDNGNDNSIPTLGRILPIVDTVEWVERLAGTPGITDIQLRIKDETLDPVQITQRVKQCQRLCAQHNVRLWINDHWQAALEGNCFGVHVGQEDLVKCKNAGGLEQLRANNIALGISTHSYGELAAALGIRPTYISLGPVFATSSKKVQFEPQGLAIVARWRKLIPPNIPFVTIGGINDVNAAKRNRNAGSDCVAVIGAITGSTDIPKTVDALNDAMQ
jgi:thiamine-phosphate diphosphorylase